ncbi:MAG: potassium transporter TrkG [Desulfatibacillaceae bacterium]|nr:potassium transporter TrkG [Desulfatibacillaceae bacterium]
MRWSRVLRVVGVLIIFIGMAMLPSLMLGLYLGETRSIKAFAAATALTLGVGGGLFLYFRKAGNGLTHRDGFAIVALTWIGAGVFGALPFYFGGVFNTFCDCAFESFSGFTTTGSSVLANIEALERSQLLWRSLIQWLGGMGIIVLSLAILPFLGVAGMQLYKAEVATPMPDKLTPKIRDTALMLWKVYLLLTLLEIFLLLVGGMGVFDAVCHAMTTLPSGGFSTQNASVGQYGSAYFEWVIFFFMVLAGINFSLHYSLLQGNPKAYLTNPECRFFLILLAVFVLIIFVDLRTGFYASSEKALRYGAFQVASLLSTTGYATADYELWPQASQFVLTICIFIGACAGSTSGAIKLLRLILLFKYCYRELVRLIHPRVVMPVRLGSRVVSEDVLKGVAAFFVLYLTIFVLSSLLLTLFGVDSTTAFSSVATTMGNVGPGFGAVGPMENFAGLPYAAKWLLMVCMVLGRLEIYTVIVLLVPEFWRK